MSENITTIKTTVACHMCDEFNRLSLSGFMNYAQDVAGLHAARNGFGNNELNKEGLAWIICRMHIHFYSAPRWLDEVSFRTWHKGREDGLIYRREFELCKDGNTLIGATSAWLLLNLDSRQLVRSNPLCDRPETTCGRNALEQPCQRLRMPGGKEGQFVTYHEVSRSDLDRNHHSNNAKYADWVIDALPDELFQEGKMITDFEINFNHETLLRDQVELRRLQLDRDRWIVEGLVSGTSAFISRISFRTL